MSEHRAAQEVSGADPGICEGGDLELDWQAGTPNASRHWGRGGLGGMLPQELLKWKS